MRFARSWCLVSVLAVCGGCATPSSRASDQGAPCSGKILWDEWRPETFARAKAENKLILVDVVAEWCHWCHVMDRSTYTDADVVDLVCADYVAVRVDSDARPDVAERYAEWGWPATAILTPDAQPVLERRGYQEASEFADLLRKTEADFRAGRPIARAAPERKPVADGDLTKIGEIVGARLDSLYDRDQDGWGRPQKYPLSEPVERELLLAWLTGDATRKDRALATLTREMKLIDPVWGGMYQYSTDGDWDHPHFEKIVPVQAGAISNFADAYAATGDQRMLDAAKALQRYVRERLTSDDGGFYTSQDADVRSHDDPESGTDGHDFFRLDDAARRAKGEPRVDTNVYADRNGMLVQALCRLHEATRDPAPLAAARKAANRVVKTHAGPFGGFTHKEAAASGALPILHLADQVEMGRAFLALAQAGAETSWIARAETLAQTMRDRFEDKTGGGFYAHTLDEKATGVFAERRKPFEDNARAARFLIRLHHVTGEQLWLQSAEKALRAMGDAKTVAAEGRFVGDYLLAVESLAHPPLHVTVVGKQGAKETVALYAAALKAYSPNRIVKLSAPGDEYPDMGESAVYVCTDRSCSPPITDPAKLAAEISGAARK